MSSNIILEAFLLIIFVSFFIFSLGVIIPIGYTLGSFISDKLVSFLGRF